MHSSKRLTRAFGDQLGDPVDDAVGDLSTRPGVATAARAAIVAKVMIWATRSRPYFSVT